MKRPLASVALLLAGGVWLGDEFTLPLEWLFISCFLLAWACLFRDSLRPFLLGILVLLAGWTNLAWRTAVLSPHDLRLLLDERPRHVTVQGVLTSVREKIREQGDEGEEVRTLAELDVHALRQGADWLPARGRVMTSARGEISPGIFPGRTIEVSGVINEPPGARAPGLFDYRAYLRRKGIYFHIQAEAAEEWRVIDGAEPPSPPLSNGFQTWARRALALGLPEDEAARILPAMALGWKAGLTEEVSEPFMRSGTMHLFAISGLHIALIAGILVALLRVAQAPRASCGLVAIPLLWFYTAATGWQPSAIRATIMATIVIAGWALRRPVDLLNSISAAAFIILIWDPAQLFQAGFQLSFSVVASIALLLPRFEKLRQKWVQPDPMLPLELRPAWQRWLDQPLRFVMVSLATSLAAWIGSMPFVAHYFHLVTPVSLLANLMIVPILAPAALMSCLGSLACAAWCAPAAELFNNSAWFWMRGMIRVSEWAAGLPGAYAYVPAPDAWMFVLYYLLIIAAFTGMPAHLVWRKWAAFGCLSLAGCCWLFTGLLKPPAYELTVLPVRGGDCIFFDAPGRRDDLLIDCGPASDAVWLARPFLRAKGINQLPAALLTHGDLRHVEGAGILFNEFSPVEIFTSGVPFRSQDYRRVIQAAGEFGRRLTQVHRGDSVGPWKVLHPAPGDRFPQADDNAIVLHGEFFGTRVLLLSDLGKPGQRILHEREPELRADIVVAGVPSEGEPLLDDLIETLQPRAIVLSVSEFPPQERAGRKLRARLSRHGIPVFYTSDTGAATLSLTREGWRITTARGSSITSND